MTKSQLIKMLLKQYPEYKIETITKIVNSIFKDIVDSLINEEKIEIRRFGSFSIRKRNARIISKDKPLIENSNNIIHKTIYFRASKNFKKIINE